MSNLAEIKYKKPRIIRCLGWKSNPVRFFPLNISVYCTKLSINDSHGGGKKTIEAIFEIPFLSQDTRLDRELRKKTAARILTKFVVSVAKAISMKHTKFQPFGSNSLWVVFIFVCEIDNWKEDRFSQPFSPNSTLDENL